MTFEDIADIGDGWYHGIAANDQQVTSTASSAEVILPYGWATAMQLPHPHAPTGTSGFRLRATRAFSVVVELLCDSVVTLRAGSDRIEVSTKVGQHGVRPPAARPFPHRR